VAFRVHLADGELYRLPLACGAEVVYVALVSHGLVAHAELVVLAVAFDTHGDLCVGGYCRRVEIATDGGESAVVREGYGSREFAMAFRGEG